MTKTHGRSPVATLNKMIEYLGFLPIFLHEGNHKETGIFAAILRSILQFSPEQITDQTIKAEKRVISMGLVVIVEPFPFLTAIAINI